MASKFGLAGGIPERRVRPIWDAIDSRQFKNALKLVTSLLSKYPKSPYALALKALIFERMGKTDEALSVCLDAKELLYKDDSVLMDDLTLSTLQIVLQRLDHLDLATSCYAHACGKFPNNLELMMGLFNCYVREYSFVKQQQTAIKMYKLAGEERFLLWAVCSIQLQVLCDKSGEKLLLLAEGLLKKHIAAHSMHEPEALMVYISLLEQQSKYNDALEVISGNLGSLLMIEVDKLRIQGRLLARENDYSAAIDVYKKILELSPDDWECFLHYLGCLLEDDSIWKYFDNIDQVHPTKHIECKFSHLTEEMFDSRISSASDLVQKLQRDTEDTNLRGPHLAELEIEKRKFLFGKKNENKLLESLLQYFLKFGHLACYASDVEAYLQVLSPIKKAEFVEMLMKSSDSCSTSAAKVLGQTTTVFKVQELTGNIFGLPVGEIEASAVKLVKLYCQNLPLSKDLDPQESMFGEELLSLINNMLVQLFWRTQDFGYLVEAIMVLELGLTIRGHVWQYKILLLHLYSYIGALPLAFERYKALDVKNILTETVSHHILRQMLGSPMWVDLSDLLKDYLKFMDDHLRESADLTFLAYRHRNYSKVIEFVIFKERLQHSNQYQAARVEASVLQLKQSADSIPEEERILENLKSGVQLVELSNEIGSGTLRFNEDMQTRPWWTPCPEKNYLLGPFEEISYCPKENVNKDREENMKRAIQRKSLLPRMIYLSVQCTSTALKASVETNGSGGDLNIFGELKFLLEEYTKMLGCSLSEGEGKGNWCSDCFHRRLRLFASGIELVGVKESSGHLLLEMNASGLTVTPPRFHFRWCSDRFGTSQRSSQAFTVLSKLSNRNSSWPVLKSACLALPTQRSNAMIARAMSASFGNMADDSTASAIFPRINIKDPYKRLGISRMASEDEIQGARNFLIQQYVGHKPSVDAIESAHDKIIMQKFHERKNPKIDIKKKVRQVRQSKVVNFVFERFQTPPTAFLIKTAVTFAVLGLLTILFPTEEGPTLQVGLSLMATFYFIHQRLKKKLWSFLYGTGAFIFSWLVGTFLMVSVVPPFIKGPRGFEVMSSLLSYILLWVASSYLR